MTNDSYLAILRDTVRLAKVVVRICSRTRVVEGMNLWLFGLAAKTASTGQSLVHLLECKHTSDTKMLLRSLNEGLTNVLFVLETTGSHRNDLERMIAIESAFDRYDRLAFYTFREGKSIKQIISSFPQLKTIIKGYEKAKAESKERKANQTSESWWHKRWRDISFEEKRKEFADLDRALKVFGYSIHKLGNAHAHSRPITLRHFMYPQDSGKVGVHTRANQTDFYYSDDWLAFEAATCLLILSDQLIDRFYLNMVTERLEDRVKTILKRLQARPRPKSSKQNASNEQLF